ncbi:hypothetical protein CAPTEDRAFT_129163 [Capitella teleta]|uniref:Cytochrome P450 n=1 Tax=Capitella teleta TaxID=283909 RepID=R7UPP4_CAPTE|nr:hypothetical protein CAPTEDRAFT_129163 [Capitella teleta]|eukprot:ELU08494.1 hypothetical protein CAPTEDRAFT_129163 [Capitella teleta]
MSVLSIADNLRGLPPYGTDLSAFLLIAVTCLFIAWCFKRSRSAVDQRLPPGSYGLLPFIGETFPFLLDGPKYTRTRIEKYGPVFRSHLLLEPIVVVSGAQHVNTILATDDVIQLSFRSTKLLFGDSGFYSMNGEPHRMLNRSLRSAFTPTVMASLIQPMQNIVRERLHGWTKLGLIQGCEASKDIAITAANQLILGLDFKGAEFEKLKSCFSDYSDAFFSFPYDIPGFAFRRKVLINPSLDGFSILHTLLSTNSNLDQSDDSLTTRQVQDIALEMLYASQETLASSFCTLLMQLAENPRVLNDLRAELATNDIGPNDILDYKTLKSLPFLNDVMKEMLRYAPPIGGGLRKAVKDVEIAGYVIPAGWRILFSIEGTHKLCKYNGDVETFDPYRWKKLRVEDPHHSSRFDFIPFGAGNRTCVGQDYAKDLIKVFLLEISRCIDWQMVNGMPDIASCPIPLPRDGLPLSVKPFDMKKFKEIHESSNLASEA